MQKIENIILDYGNVIFMIDFEKSQHAFTQLGISNVAEIFAHSGQIELFDDFDKGNISAAEFRDGIRHLTKNNTLTDGEIDMAWNALLIGVPEGKHELLLKLKNKYRTFLLSNNNEIHYAYCMKHIQDKYGIEDNSFFFDFAYYSHMMGMRKPNADIFEYVLKDQNLDPKKTLFIDDSPQHLRTATALGLHTALCTTEEPLEVIVSKWNLL
ncbi:HAD family hydrolase [Sphingobacterium composti Ten et al. 2007 non Yoo et al. 2007]|uniref:HAD family hydrolase n=1 Tax=Sphingobacterium composti TaxID=363260 RepID=UPI0013583FE6|nr:HAD family phosphatase [Sphingobacterium composti Ten et al. 2007 non Yoo et al. 2007]